MDRPNILYLHSHDTGRYVSPYGFDVPTPNIQRLAEQGILFRQAFCTNPTCSASRSSLLTGQWPHNNGMTGLAHRGWTLNDYGHHVIRTLHANGYHSTLCGVQHVANWRDGSAVDKIGYQEHLTEGDEDWSVRAADWLKNAPSEPFFLSCGFVETHRKFPEPACDCRQTDPRYTRPPLPIQDTPETRADMAAFNTIARTLDTKMGRVLDALQESGLADRTLVICTTDHGIAFPRMKCNLEDSGIGVMLIMRGPGGFEGGRALDGMVSHLDIFPTFCEYLGIEPPDWLQGVSFMPMVRGEARGGPRGAVRRGELARGLRTAAGGTDQPLEVHQAIRRTHAPRAAQLRRQPDKDGVDGGRMGRPADLRGGALRSRLRPERGEQPRGRPGPRGRAGRHARPPEAVDGGNRRPAVEGPRSRAQGRDGQRPGRRLAERSADDALREIGSYTCRRRHR